MFKNEFQGGPCVEVFSGQGKDPGGPWKFTGSSGIHRTYDDELKSFVFHLEGTTSTTKMQLPKDTRQSLCLTQRFLVIQVYIAQKTDFAIEINLTDNSKAKHRIFMSTSQKDISVSPLLAKVPLFIIKRNIWVSLCLDLVSFVGELWPKQSFRQLDCLVISANCRLARVCTLCSAPADTSDDSEVYGIPREQGEAAKEPIPRQIKLPSAVPNVCQVLNISKLRLIEWRSKSGGGGPGGDSSAGSSSRENSAEVPRSAPVSSSSTSVRHRRCGSEPGGPPLEPHPPPGDSKTDASRRRRRVRVKTGGSSSAGKANGGRGASGGAESQSPHERRSAGSEYRTSDAGGTTEDMVATGHRMEAETRPPPPVKKKSGVYFFSSQPKAAAPNMTNISTDGESEPSPSPGAPAVRQPQKSSLLPQNAGDSPQHHGRAAVGDSRSPSSSRADGNRRVALLRRSLREISQSVLQDRMAAQQKQQNPHPQQRANLNLDHLMPGDMSDSFEARMLLSMKAENEDDEEESEAGQHQQRAADGRLRNPHLPAGSRLHPTTTTAKRQPRLLVAGSSSTNASGAVDDDEESTRLPMHTRMHLSDESSDGEEMSTGRSTGRVPPPGPADSFYLQEMQMGWPGQGGGLGTTCLSQDTMPIEPVSASPLPPPSSSHSTTASGSSGRTLSGKQPPQQQDERLELLYDPDLNCYFDPETLKYYELL